MRRKIMPAFIFLLFSTCFAFPAVQADEKTAAEKYIQKVSRIKSNEIEYAYISTSMLKHMFGVMDGNVTLNGIGNILTPLKSLRRFITTGSDGYALLAHAMLPFMVEEGFVMGMEMMALSRESGTFSVIYGDEKNLLVINEENDELSVVFVVGLTFDTFMKLRNSSGVNFNLF